MSVSGVLPPTIGVVVVMSPRSFRPGARRIVGVCVEPEDSMADESRGALAGMRVLDISTFLAGPQISAILADFGADVVKIEPPTGEVSCRATRGMGPLLRRSLRDQQCARHGQRVVLRQHWAAGRSSRRRDAGRSLWGAHL